MDGGRRICLHLAKAGFDLDVNSKWIFISDASQGPVRNERSKNSWDLLIIVIIYFYLITVSLHLLNDIKSAFPRTRAF